MDVTTRNWLIVLAGTAIRVGLNFGVGVLLTRILGPTDFGTYTLLAAITSIVGVAVELGLTETGVKQISAQADTHDILQTARQLINFRLGIGALGTLLLLPFSGIIARDLLQQPSYQLILIANFRKIFNYFCEVFDFGANVFRFATDRFIINNCKCTF